MLFVLPYFQVLVLCWVNSYPIFCRKTKPNLPYFVIHAYMFFIKSWIFVDNYKVGFIHDLIKDKIINLHIKQKKYLISKVGESTSVGESTKHPGKKEKDHYYVCNLINGDFPTQVIYVCLKEVPCPSYHCKDRGNPHCQKRKKSSS